MGQTMRTAKLSPSDFAFLYEDCKRCFYLKVAREIIQPSKPMASIFTKIDNQEKITFADKYLSEFSPDFPNGKIIESDKWVTSKYITYEENNYRQYIRGIIDSLIKMKDGTYQIIDFKTSAIDKHIQLYTKQLHAYAYALENPMYDRDKLDAPISGLGLIIFNPNKGFHIDDNCDGLLRGEFNWIQMKYTPDKFIKFMDKLASLLSQDEIPEFTEGCQYCERDKLMMEWNNVPIIDTVEKEKEEEEF